MDKDVGQAIDYLYFILWRRIYLPIYGFESPIEYTIARDPLTPYPLFSQRLYYTAITVQPSLTSCNLIDQFVGLFYESLE